MSEAIDYRKRNLQYGTWLKRRNLQSCAENRCLWFLVERIPWLEHKIGVLMLDGSGLHAFLKEVWWIYESVKEQKMQEPEAQSLLRVLDRVSSGEVNLTNRMNAASTLGNAMVKVGDKYPPDKNNVITLPQVEFQKITHQVKKKTGTDN